MFKAIGDAAYKAATKAGIAAGTEQPPYPCALPLRVISDPTDTAAIEQLAGEIRVAARELLGRDNRLRRAALLSGRVDATDRRRRWDADSAWRPLDYRDPDPTGDCVLLSKPHIGTYNFAKATMTFRDCAPDRILDTMHGDDFATRKKFSADLARFEILARPTATTNIQYHEYRAPPPVSPRHLIYLFERLYQPEADTHLVYGCSIDYPPFHRGIGRHTIRAVCLWCWELTAVGRDTLATYASCMSPNGWAPTFVMGWMKNEIGKELTSIRRVLYQQEHGKRLEAAAQKITPKITEKITEKSTKNTQNDTTAEKERREVYEIRPTVNSPCHSSGSEEEEEEERPQREESFLWRELQESEELLLF